VGFVLRPGGDADDAFCFALPHDVEEATKARSGR
jgi:hypothetical protein